MKRTPTMNSKLQSDKTKILRILLVFLNLTPTQVAKVLNVSNSVISKHLSGEKTYYPCDIFLIEQIVHIKIEGYKRLWR